MNCFREFLYKLTSIKGETPIPCGAPISYAGLSGIFIINVTLGTDLGIAGLVHDAQSVPDRFQIFFDGNLVADSKYVGDGLTGNPPNYLGNFVGNVYNNVPEFYWDGTQFVANGNTQNLTILQEDVAEFGLTDGNGSISFDKQLAAPGVMTIYVFAPLGGTAWTIDSTSCPVNTYDTINLSTTSLSGTWQANTVTNGGAVLRWNATNGITYGKDGNNPVFDLNDNLGTVDFSIYDTVLVTDFNVENLLVTSIDVSNSPGLLTLNVGDNSLTSLDVTANTSLTTLNFYLNNIPTIDLSNNTALVNLSCFDAGLTALSVTNNTLLQNLFLSNNTVATLNVSTNTALLNLECSNNSLSALSVTTNTLLTSLLCDGNTISTLDVSANTALVTLDCSSNSLTNLSITNNTALTTLRCDGNSLVAGDIDNIVIQLDTNGLSNGTLDIPLGRTAASDAAKASLQGKGWTVTEI